MSINILSSKLAIPRPISHAIERKRLIEAVDNSSDVGLILLVAPAGYGKTTLAQQILSARPNAKYAWYHLDDSDGRSDQFLAYLVASLKPAMPKYGDSILTAEISQSIENLCLAVEQYRGPHVYLVLDNWECVDHNREIATLPSLLARSGLGRMTTIVASRIPPSFNTRREQSRGSILRFDMPQLAFSLPECHEAMRLRLGRDVEDEMVARFWKETSGWCVSVGMLLSTPSHTDSLSSARALASPKSDDMFLDYFREELFENLSPEFARFLCETSFFDVLTRDRCISVCGEVLQVDELLRELDRSAIPHVKLQQPGQYRLHALVRQAFRFWLRNTTDPERLAEIHRLSADRYLSEDLIAEAIELLMELGDFDRALDLMGKEWSRLFAQRGWLQAQKWLQQLPPTYHDHPTYIKTYSNLLNVSGDNRGSIAFLTDKLNPERFQDDIESFGSLWANYWWARINAEPGSHYLAVLKAHDELLASTTGFSQTMLGIFQNTLSMAAHLELRLSDALAHVRKAADLVEEPYARLRVIARQNEALYTHLAGDSVTALKILEQIREECHRLSLAAQLPKISILEASTHLSMGRYREVLSDVEQCISTMREAGNFSLQLDAYVGRFKGLALWYLGEREEGLRLLMSAREPAKEYGALTGLELSLLCEYYSLMNGQPLHLVDDAEVPGETEINECRLTYLALQAIRALDKKNLPALKKYASQMYNLGSGQDMPQWMVTGLFFLVTASGHVKVKEREKESLTQALDTLSRIGWRTYPMNNDDVTAAVVARATRFGLDLNTVEALLSNGAEIDLAPAFEAELSDRRLDEEERVRLWEAAARWSVRGLASQLKKHYQRVTPRTKASLDLYQEFLDHADLPPLRISALGTFVVSAKGRIVRFNRSASRLLLQQLLVAHPKKIHEEELIESIWPETDPAKSTANLRTTVKDLRRSLDPYAVPRGQSYVVYEDEHYGLQLPVGSHIDFHDFAQMLKDNLHDDPLASRLAGDRIIGLRRALAAYHGPLLPMLPYESFAVEQREHLQALFQKGSLKLAELLIASGEFEEAAAIVDKALSYDQLWTEGVRMLLKINALRGEILKAMRVYRNYETRLKNELSLEPDENIRRFFNDILGSGPITPG